MWLKLRWARFFTLAGWNWKLSSRPSFDFQVSFPCRHSECRGSHTLLVRVVNQTHDALIKSHGKRFDINQMYAEPHPALFGDGPDRTHWQMVHGAGGGDESVSQWIPDALNLWERAAHE